MLPCGEQGCLGVRLPPRGVNNGRREILTQAIKKCRAFRRIPTHPFLLPQGQMKALESLCPMTSGQML